MTPAPNSGKPFSLDRAAAEKEPTRQIGVRVPASLYDRLAACSESTGVPIARLVRRSLETELTRLEGAEQ